jgi:hypothetical protein
MDGRHNVLNDKLEWAQYFNETQNVMACCIADDNLLYNRSIAANNIAGMPVGTFSQGQYKSQRQMALKRFIVASDVETTSLD